MPLQATSGAASYDAFGGGVPVEPVYIEQIFSTYLYTGNGSSQTITNGIDLSTKGGLVWLKYRTDGGANHIWTDTVRGATKSLYSNATDAQATVTQHVTGFTTSGFSVGNNGNVNDSGGTFASWTFRKQPKFFDVVTFSTTNSANARISHNLGSVPACYIIKRIDGAGNWFTYHTSLGRSAYVSLNATNASASSTDCWGTSDPTTTDFGVNEQFFTNGTVGLSYIAYVFASNAGGFGLTGTDNVISCGSFTTNSTGDATVSLGYEPQWVMTKRSDGTGDWYIVDSMRGNSALNGTTNTEQILKPNSSAAESSTYGIANPTSTGFQAKDWGSVQTFIYIAIRRGPMKVPTSGTSVFAPIYQTPQSAGTLRTVGFPADLMIGTYTAAATPRYVNTRLTGLANNSGSAQTTPKLQTQSTAAESNAYPLFYDVWNTTARDGDYIFGSNGINWMFGRAPSFFDVVCYTGNGSTQNVSHNLGAVPELMIVKSRSLSDSDWWVYASALTTPQNKYLRLQSTDGESTATGLWGSSLPTSTTFGLGAFAPNSSGATFVAYLFATCAGVSKVGSYTGTATTLQVDCGFTGGARFVLIKRTDSTGSWYVWDSSRGIVSGNDPYLLLNSTAAEVTNTDYIDTYSAGFEISSTAPSEINASGGTFIFLAIA